MQSQACTYKQGPTAATHGQGKAYRQLLHSHRAEMLYTSFVYQGLL